MDLLLSSVVLILALTPFILFVAFLSTLHDQPTVSKERQCELAVTNALRALDMKSYVVFENLILPSTGYTPHTEIDHVVVSPFGIFCIETKSHQGSIYGYTTSGAWKQYLGGRAFPLGNPFRQNYKHVQALKQLLGFNIKAKIHSYVVFPYARFVKVDGEYVDYSIDAVMHTISRHTTPVYNLQECEKIVRSLAYASSMRDELKDVHIREVQTYLRERVA